MSASRTTTRRLTGGLTAGLAAAALVALSAGPGAAATVVAQASASALIVTVAGQSQDSGTYRVSNDGTTETSSGSTQAAAPAIPGGGVASVGVLAQDATTQVVRGDGRSAACSGLAGDGAGTVQVGGGACLEPGDTLTLAGGSLDLSALLSGQFPGATLPAELQTVIDQLLALPGGGTPAQVGAQIDTIIDQVLGALGDPSLTLDVGAIQSACIASAPSSAEGDSLLTDVSLDASFAGQDLTLLEFPASPPPNTSIATGADDLVAAINQAIRAQLTTALGGAGAPLTGLTDAITTINDMVITQIAPQLAPLEDNLLSGILNRQTTSPGSIDVTAMSVEVLPAAQQFLGSSLAAIEVGNVTCGPSGRVAPTPASPTPTPNDPAPPVPTFVPAGEAGTAAARTDDGGLNETIAMWTLGGLALVSGGVGVAAYRRAAR